MIEDLLDHVQPRSSSDRRCAVELYATRKARLAAGRRSTTGCGSASPRRPRPVGCRPPAPAEERRRRTPSRQRLWLAHKLGITLDESVRDAASQQAWEDQASRTAERYLLSRRADEALDVLHEREERLPRSELFSLEAEAYRFLGRHDDALRVARAGVESTAGAGAIDVALELLLKMVVIEEGRMSTTRRKRSSKRRPPWRRTARMRCCGSGPS